MVLHPETGEKLASAKDIAKRLRISDSYLHKLHNAGELRRYVESPRRVFYYLDEVERLSKRKAEARKKRGGRPRKGNSAA